MKKIILLMLVSILALSVAGCSSNSEDKDSTNNEDKTEDKENKNDSILEKVMKNIDSYSAITVEVNDRTTNGEYITTAKGTINFTNNDDYSDKEVISTVTQADGSTNEFNYSIINGKMQPDEPLGGAFIPFSDKFSNYLVSDGNVKETKNGENTVVTFDSKVFTKVTVEISKDNLPVLLKTEGKFNDGAFYAERTYTNIAFSK